MDGILWPGFHDARHARTIDARALLGVGAAGAGRGHTIIGSAIWPDIDSNPGESRFEKAGPGLFALTER